MRPTDVRRGAGDAVTAGSDWPAREPDSRGEIEASGFFDRDWYLAQYPDVAFCRMNPLQHYLWLGWRLCRDPGPEFDTGYYLRANPDVAASRGNPLLHYVRFGRAEGRAMRASAQTGGAPAGGNAPGPQRARHRSVGGGEAWLNGLAAEDVLRVEHAFDAAYYLRENSELGLSPGNAFRHYMQTGWREGRDPSPGFSGEYYLEHAPALRQAGLNPFVHYVLHGIAEKRPGVPFHRRLEAMAYSPTVTAIVPNYNHARFLEQRIDSILNQTYRNVEIVILDDCSTDDSGALIARYRDRHPDRVRAIFNDRNAGSVFTQWRKGVEHATGELVWICESDDFCEPDFLERLVASFKDRSVQIAFGRIQFADAEGRLQAGLEAYREGAESGIWDRPVIRPSCTWFTRGFGVNNVIANVGGCVWRRQSLPAEVWSEAETFTVLGDWFLYYHLAGGGQIAYDPAAVAYFRQHGGNTSVSSFMKAPYYREHHRVMHLLTSRWLLPAETIDRFVGKLASQYRHLNMAEKLGPFEAHIRADELKRARPRAPHVLIAFLGFHPGGGEVFPINLANALHDKGVLVSMLALDTTSVNAEMAAALNPAIPVYDAGYVLDVGADRFVAEAGVTLIHSHMASLEQFFFDKCRMRTRLPYLATLHGSYEASDISEPRLEAIAERVSHFAYTADKNIEPFRGLAVPEQRFSKIGNGMPDDPRDFPMMRAELGIAPDAVVFTLVARGIRRKGWRAAVQAFLRLRAMHPGRSMHLLLCGEGEETERQKATCGDDPDITFLGYQSRINGLYRLSDCAVVPSRFAGESFPLCVIQAMQAGTPVIATRVGEIPAMLGEAEQAAGVLIDAERDTERFIGRLTSAMAELLDPDRRRLLSERATARARLFAIDACADEYVGLYERLLNRHAQKDRDAHAE